MDFSQKLLFFAVACLLTLGAIEPPCIAGPEGPISPVIEREIRNKLESLVSDHSTSEEFRRNIQTIRNLSRTFHSVRLFLFELHQLEKNLRLSKKWFDTFLKFLREYSRPIESVSDLKQAFQDFLESEENKNSLDSRLKEDLLALLDRTHVRIRSPHPSLIDLKDLSPKEIERILSLMSEIRDHPGRFNTTLQGKSGSTFLLKPSTRTKTSSERALINLGAQVIDLTAEASQYRHGEPLEHTVLALSGNTDFIFFRGFDHSEFESIARDSRVPMINGLTNRFHPLQALADTWTLLQIFGKRGLKGRKFLFMGDGKSNEISSLISILPQYGVSVRIVTPPDPRFAVNTRSLEEAKLRIQANHFEGTIDVTNSPAEEAQIADIIYVDSFRVMEATAEENANRVQYFIENGFQLNDLLLQRAKPSIKIMHAMPIHEGEEVSSREIVERPQSLMMQQADARVLSAMATLVWIHESTRSDLIQTTLSCGELLK